MRKCLRKMLPKSGQEVTYLPSLGLLPAFNAGTVASIQVIKVILIPTTASIGESLTCFVSWIKIKACHIGRTQTFILWTGAKWWNMFPWFTQALTCSFLREYIYSPATQTRPKGLTCHGIQVEEKTVYWAYHMDMFLALIDKLEELSRYFRKSVGRGPDCGNCWHCPSSLHSWICGTFAGLCHSRTWGWGPDKVLRPRARGRSLNYSLAMSINCHCLQSWDSNLTLWSPRSAFFPTSRSEPGVKI